MGSLRLGLSGLHLGAGSAGHHEQRSDTERSQFVESLNRVEPVCRGTARTTIAIAIVLFRRVRQFYGAYRSAERRVAWPLIQAAGWALGRGTRCGVRPR